MVKISTRIEDLQKQTGSLAVKEICEAAISEISEIYSKRISSGAKKELETILIENMISDLTVHSKDKLVENFLRKEKSRLSLDNLGVKDSLRKISESDLKNHPAITYTIKKFEGFTENPDYLIAEEFYTQFKPFDWHPIVKESLSKVYENILANKDDIAIQRAVYGLKNSRSAYLLKGINESLELFLDTRSKKNKEELLEKLSNFSFDANIRNLKSSIISSNDTDFYIKEGIGQAVPSNIYSIVKLNKNSEIFGTGSEFYEKTNNNLRRLSESEINALPSNVKQINHFLNSDSVKIVGESVIVYGTDRKFVLEESAGQVYISVGDKKMTNEEFQTIFMKSGVISRKNTNEAYMINMLIENFNDITNIDFAKRITSPNMDNRRVDIFKIDENIYVTKEDPTTRRIDFYTNLNATQSRNLVLEYLNYDISESFANMINSEDKIIKEFEKTKVSYIKAISSLEEKLHDLQTIDDTEILESAEYNSIINIVASEIETLKSEYSTYVANVLEMQDAGIPSPAEDSAKEISEAPITSDIKIDSRVTCTNLGVSGTVISIGFTTEGDESIPKYTILTDDGKSISLGADEIALEGSQLSEGNDLEGKLDKVTKFIDKLDGIDKDKDDEEEGEDDKEEKDDEDDDTEGEDDEEFDVDGLDAEDPDLKTESIIETCNIGDEVELVDGTRAKINGITDNELLIIDDEGKSSNINIADVASVIGIETGSSDVISGQASDGKSVDV